jgi:hypothetical protein
MGVRAGFQCAKVEFVIKEYFLEMGIFYHGMY